MRTFLTLSILLILIAINSLAQSLSKQDIIQKAIEDAKLFKLNNVDLARFRKDRNYYRTRLSRPSLRPDRTEILKFGAGRDTVDYNADFLNLQKKLLPIHIVI